MPHVHWTWNDLKSHCVNREKEGNYVNAVQLVSIKLSQILEIT